MNSLKSLFNAVVPGILCPAIGLAEFTLLSNARHDTFFIRFDQATQDAVSSTLWFGAVAIGCGTVAATKMWYKYQEKKATPAP